jgi:NADH:ubiquinone oxidoreductase subunit F (NADH-binding)
MKCPLCHTIMIMAEWVGVSPCDECIFCRESLRKNDGVFIHCKQGHYGHKDCKEAAREIQRQAEKSSLKNRT